MADLCQNCKKPEPQEGWYMAGACDGHLEFFCSAKCLDLDLNSQGDEDIELGEDCGRWRNGRLSLQCSKAGSEECDWICPIGLPRS